MQSDRSRDDHQAPKPDAADDELTPEEWAELERATEPDAPGAAIAEDPPKPRVVLEVPRVLPSGSKEAENPELDALTAPEALAAATEMYSSGESPDQQGTPDADQESSAFRSLVEVAEPHKPALPAEKPTELPESGAGAAERTDGRPAAAGRADPAAENVEGADHADDPTEAGEFGESEGDRLEGDAAAESAEETARPSALRMPLPRVIAVANQKGGVGKTTTTVNVAACLAEQGYRTLLVDLDPQANASTGLGLEPRELAHSIYHVMLHGEAADSCIEPTEVKNLFVLPSSLDLAGAEIELVSMMSREHRLRLAIESVLDDYDYVLIDCPPSLGLLTINALTAAKEVLVPIQCEYYALEGLGQLMRNVELVKANLNPTLQISHIILVMFDPRTNLAGQVVDEVRSHFGSIVCQNVIPRTVRLSEAPSFGQPITTFDTASRGATAYRAVTQEVLDGQA